MRILHSFQSLTQHRVSSQAGPSSPSAWHKFSSGEFGLHQGQVSLTAKKLQSSHFSSKTQNGDQNPQNFAKNGWRLKKKSWRSDESSQLDILSLKKLSGCYSENIINLLSFLYRKHCQYYWRRFKVITRLWSNSRVFEIKTEKRLLTFQSPWESLDEFSIPYSSKTRRKIQCDYLYSLQFNKLSITFFVFTFHHFLLLSHVW